MQTKSWDDQAIDEILDFLQANVVQAAKSRKRAATQARTLAKKIDGLVTSVERTSQDIQILRQRIDAAEAPIYAPLHSVGKL